MAPESITCLFEEAMRHALSDLGKALTEVDSFNNFLYWENLEISSTEINNILSDNGLNAETTSPWSAIFFPTKMLTVSDQIDVETNRTIQVGYIWKSHYTQKERQTVANWQTESWGWQPSLENNFPNEWQIASKAISSSKIVEQSLNLLLHFANSLQSYIKMKDQKTDKCQT